MRFSNCIYAVLAALLPIESVAELLATSSSQQLSIDCPDVLVQGAQNKTYLLCRSPKTYSQAAKSAGTKKINNAVGYLSNIESEAENSMLVSWLKSAIPLNELGRTSAADEGRQSFIWLGGDDLRSEGDWTWQRAGVQGYPRSFWAGNERGASVGLYTNWSSSPAGQSEPDNDRGIQDGLAMAIDGRSSGQWYDVNTSNQLYYLVEFDSTESASSEMRVAIEEPIMGLTHSGIGSIRGWAISGEAITKVEIFIDGIFAFEAPYGGPRGDVGSAYPEIADSHRSGFSVAFNFNSLDIGPHDIAVIAQDDAGRIKQASANFEVVSFKSEFLAAPLGVTLDDGSCAISRDEISITDALVNGSAYDIWLKWRPSSQAFEIEKIE